MGDNSFAAGNLGSKLRGLVLTPKKNIQTNTKNRRLVNKAKDPIICF